jgi:hypothetical protein
VSSGVSQRRGLALGSRTAADALADRCGRPLDFAGDYNRGPGFVNPLSHEIPPKPFVFSEKKIRIAEAVASMYHSHVSIYKGPRHKGGHMEFRRLEDLLAEVEKRLNGYCEKIGGADSYSGRFMISVQLNTEGARIFTPDTLPLLARELFPDGRPSDHLTVKVSDEVLSENLMSFHYRKELHRWALELAEALKA